MIQLGQLAANADEFVEFVFRPEPQPIPMPWRTIWREFRVRAMPSFVFD
jgi:hypothetical protein